MMRALVFVWLAPFAAFWGWYALAANDLFFTRAFQTEVFAIYGAMLDMPPDEVPMLFARALLLDGALIGAIFAFRRRRAIAAFLRRRFAVPAA